MVIAPTEEPVPARGRDRRVWGVLALVGAAAGVWVWTLAQRLGPIVYLPVSWDAWFDADSVRTFENMTQRTSLLLRSVLHPLAGLLARVPYLVLESVTGLAGHRCAQLELALIGSGVVVTFATLLRSLGCRWLESILLSGFLAASSAFVLFATIPETFAFGALTTIVALTLVVRAPDGWRGDLACGGALVLASAATATNVLTPFVAIVMLRSRRTWLRSGVVAIVLLGAGTLVQSRFFPLANAWPKQVVEGLALARVHPQGVVSEDLIPKQDLPHVGRVLRAFFAHSTVLPEPLMGPRAPVVLTIVPSPLPTLGVQAASLGRLTPVGMVALAGWCGIGVLGLANLSRRKADRLDGILALAMLAQLVLHVFVGRETILYALHFEPLLIALAGRLATRGPTRRIAVPLIAVTALLTAVANRAVFDRSALALKEAAHDVDLTTPPPARRSAEPPAVVTADRALAFADLPIDLELGCDGPTCEPKVGAPLRALEFEPGVWSVLLRVREAGRSGIQLHVAGSPEEDAAAGSAPWLRSEQAAIVLLQHRWIVAFYPDPIAVELRNQAGAACGGLPAPCFTADLPLGKAWRIAIADALAKPAWQGMGPLSDPRVWPTLHVHRRKGDPAGQRDTAGEGLSEPENQIRETGDGGGAEEDRTVDRPVGVGALPLQPPLGPHGQGTSVQGTAGDERDR